MRICTKCKYEKEISDFHKSKSRKDGLSVWCKECQKEHKKQHYTSYKEKYLSNNYERRKWFYDLKRELKCERCGFNHPAALDFHHRDEEEKIFNISKQYHGNPNMREEILKEIAKCEVLCANCHRIEHSKNY